MAFPFHEEPISEAEQDLIRKVSGDLYGLCEQARGTPDEDRVSEEHDAMMRLRRRSEQVEETHKALMELAYQYRDDLRHPPAADSHSRRLEAIEVVIAKAEGRS